MRFMLKTVLLCGKKSAHNPKNLGTQATHGQSNYMAKVTLGGTNNVPKAEKNLSDQCRTPARTYKIQREMTRAIVAALNSYNEKHSN